MNGKRLAHVCSALMSPLPEPFAGYSRKVPASHTVACSMGGYSSFFRRGPVYSANGPSCTNILRWIADSVVCRGALLNSFLRT